MKLAGISAKYQNKLFPTKTLVNWTKFNNPRHSQKKLDKIANKVISVSK